MNNNKIRLVCVGSNIESLVCLEKFIVNGIKISAIITGNFFHEKRGSDYRDLIPFAIKNHIPYYRTDSINSRKAKNFLRNIAPDVLFILGWSEIIDDELINIVKRYVVGSHPSDLPYGAGRAPITWTILEDLNQSAVSFFFANSKADGGDIILKRNFNIPLRPTAEILYNIVACELGKGFVEIYQNIQSKKIRSYKQDLSKRTVRRKRNYEDGLIDFNKSAVLIDRLIRATSNPFPGAHTFYKGTPFTIWSSDLSDKADRLITDNSMGEILEIKNNQLLVQCVESEIWLYGLTDSEGNNINITEFRVGQVLG